MTLHNSTSVNRTQDYRLPLPQQNKIRTGCSEIRKEFLSFELSFTDICSVKMGSQVYLENLLHIDGTPCMRIFRKQLASTPFLCFLDNTFTLLYCLILTFYMFPLKYIELHIKSIHAEYNCNTNTAQQHNQAEPKKVCSPYLVYNFSPHF